MRWTDIHPLVDALIDAHPEVDPTRLNFVDLMRWVLEIPTFSDDPNRCSERILEAIQQAWIDDM